MRQLTGVPNTVRQGPASSSALELSSEEVSASDGALDGGSSMLMSAP